MNKATHPAPTPASPASSQTAGEALRGSAGVRSAIDQLVQEVRSASARVTEVRGPLAGKGESYEALMARAAEVRARPLLYPYLGSGVGNGALVELADGSVKWDMICGIGVHFFGHSDPEMVRCSLEGSLEDVVKHGNLQSGFEPYRFAETLIALASRSSRLKHAYVATSGAMANENALKLCYQKHSPACRVIAFRDCFMGRSTTMAQIGDSADGRPGLPLSTLVDYMPFWDPQAAERVGATRFIDAGVAQLAQYLDRYPGQHACFIFELVQGEGGFNVGNRDYFKALMELCRSRKVAVWDDEIQTFGRLPSLFAYEHFDLGDYVEVFCVGKMTQACATLWTRDYNPRGTLLSGTFTGEGPSFRVGTRVLERLRDGNFYGPQGLFQRHFDAFVLQARTLIARHPDWFPPVPEIPELVGGLGGMMRLTPFGGVKERVQKAARAIYDEGAVLFYCGHGPYHVRMLPPLPAMKLEDWPRVFACIERGLSRVASAS